ncbi:phage integrase N-terminal SAM-like domain-containing protein [Pistricoccus aurantiacus]|uniref:phage integrase N-terminal SAM-like domain-containing protein n=1 Tax=Pistricoccus aurantiacus TaxID=1883414 RepID=UPI001C97AD40|nr:phage integrase N-terminal SAM-like domain-containing protein [Pistricoccus aurantiacus]
MNFLEYLAVERRVAAATQNQALNVLVFLYRHILEQSQGILGSWCRHDLSLSSPHGCRRLRRPPASLSCYSGLRASMVANCSRAPLCIVPTSSLYLISSQPP